MYLAFVVSFVLYDYFTDIVDLSFMPFLLMYILR